MNMVGRARAAPLQRIMLTELGSAANIERLNPLGPPYGFGRRECRVGQADDFLRWSPTVILSNVEQHGRSQKRAPAHHDSRSIFETVASHHNASLCERSAWHAQTQQCPASNTEMDR
jgi:hypothetical protein